MSTELDIYRGSSLSDRQTYAMTLARAVDILPKALRKVNPQDPQAAREETAARAFLIMETGDMLGLHPMAALAGVNVIEGKPALSSGLMSAVIRSAGHKLHVTESGTIEGGDYKATATLIREDDPDHPFSSTWTPHRAQRAGLCKYEEGTNGIWKVTARSQGGAPLPWEAYTESLCKSRAISEVSRDGGQDALLGIRYTPEELESGAEEFVGELTQPTEEPTKPARKTPARGTQGTKRRAKAAPVDMTPPADSDAADRDAVRPEEETPGQDIVDAELVEEPTSAQTAEFPPTSEQEEAEREEREERARIAAEAEAKVRAEDAQAESALDADAEARKAEVKPETLAKLREARNPDAKSGESEVDYQQRKLREAKAQAAEHTARPFVDTHDGATYGTQEELDAAIKARVQAKAAERAQEAQKAAGGSSAYLMALAEEPGNFERQVAAAETLEQIKDVWDRANAADGAMTTALRLTIIKAKAAMSPRVED